MMTISMSKSIELSIVSPVYNDAHTLLPILKRIISYLRKHRISSELVLLDDASVDGSVELVKTLRSTSSEIRFFAHKKNQGIAKTYRELYAKAKGDIVALFSLDGEWDTHDLFSLISHQRQCGCDVVVGDRTTKHYSLFRSIVSWAYNQLTRFVFGVATHDAGSIKVFQNRVLHIPIISLGVFDEAERLIRADKAGYVIHHLPISQIPAEKKRTGINIRHIAEALVDMVRVRWDILY
jgi:glycosyltransferase involved in cell wall biosynthesis